MPDQVLPSDAVLAIGIVFYLMVGFVLMSVAAAFARATDRHAAGRRSWIVYRELTFWVPLAVWSGGGLYLLINNS